MFINYNNPTVTTHNFLQQLKIKVTILGVDTILQKHPYYPSLLSITDTLSNYKVDNVAYKIEAIKLAELPTPFIAFFKNNGGNFVVVTVVKNNVVTYILNNKTTTASQEAFLKNWNEIVVIAEATAQS